MIDDKSIIIYETQDGEIKIDVKINCETLWLSQAQISQLYGRERSVITKHIKNIFTDNELNEIG